MAAIEPSGEPAPSRGGAYDYAGPVRWEYSPELDRDADPGEVVWTWVAYEEDRRLGKDRPVAVVGRAEDGRLAALMLSSRDHSGERGWLPIGSGPWDRQGRDSWVRMDRMLAVPGAAVRREGAILPRATYDRIVASLAGAAGPRPPERSGASGRARPRLLARIMARVRGQGRAE